MNWVRKSRSNLLRSIIAKQDYNAKRDMSWARTDSCANVRMYAAQADALHTRKDISWMRTDSSSIVRSYAAMIDFLKGNDMSWTIADPNPNIRLWASKELVQKYKKTR